MSTSTSATVIGVIILLLAVGIHFEDGLLWWAVITFPITLKGGAAPNLWPLAAGVLLSSANVVDVPATTVFAASLSCMYALSR